MITKRGHFLNLVSYAIPCSGYIAVLQMERKQVNLRVPVHLLEQIKKHAKKEGVNHTQWIVDACIARLGGEGEPFQNLKSNAEEDPITALQREDGALWDAVNYTSTHLMDKIEELEAEVEHYRQECNKLISYFDSDFPGIEPNEAIEISSEKPK